MVEVVAATIKKKKNTNPIHKKKCLTDTSYSASVRDRASVHRGAAAAATTGRRNGKRKRSPSQ